MTSLWLKSCAVLGLFAARLAADVNVASFPLQTNPPSPLALAHGAVANAEAWEQHRAEVKSLLAELAVGHMPPAPGNVTGHELTTRVVSDGRVRYSLIHLSFGPDAKLGFDVAVFVPTDRNGPVPTIIFPAFELTPGAEPLPLQPRPTQQGQGKDALSLPKGTPATPPAPTPTAKPRLVPEPEAVADAHADVFKRGYALLMFHYQDCGEDTIARNQDGSWAYRKSRFFPAYPDNDWGLLAAWAWGISRCIDYLNTQDFADHQRLIVTGHSRIGKAVLVAGAFDERVALSAPIGSAGGGVGLYRASGFGRGGGEGFDVVRKYPNWFSPKLRPFLGEIDRLPFDQHWFVALTAPRPLIDIEGASDPLFSAGSLHQSFRAAMPVYSLYRANDRLGLVVNPHGHAFAPADWNTLLDFADLQFRGKKSDRDFFAWTKAGPPLVIDVHATGAVGDGKTKDTSAFQQALDRCGIAGGGEMVVPKGDYLIGSIEIRAKTTLRLQEGARLLGSHDLEDYPLARVRWEGRWVQGHRALISATDVDQIAIIGPGRIEGADTLAELRDPRGPALIEPTHCAGVRLENFSTSYGLGRKAMWNIHPTRCRDVSAIRLTIRSNGGNGDGIDVDSTQNVIIEDCDIDTGDDAIAIKSGRGMEGFTAAEPASDILIRHCTLGDKNFACIGIGSEMSGSVRNVRIERCTFTHSKSNSIYIKSRPGRGGVIENIVATDLTVESADAAFLRINLVNSGKDDSEPVPGDAGIPVARQIKISNVRLSHCGGVVDAILTSPEKPVDGFVFTDVTGDSETGLNLANMKNVELRNVNVSVVKGPPIKVDRVSGKGF